MGTRRGSSTSRNTAQPCGKAGGETRRHVLGDHDGRAISGQIDQNFFESQPKIIIQYCPDGSYCVEAVNPIPKGNFETTYTYEWGFVRCQGCGSDSVKGKVATFKALKGTNIVLIVQGFRTGTNIKSVFLKTEIEI